MDLARRLADVLRRARENADLSQTEMARILGISQPTLNRLESASQNVTLRTLSQPVRLCDVTLETYSTQVGFVFRFPSVGDGRPTR